MEFNQRGDNYASLTVLFALVLFFAAASTRFSRPRPQWVLIGLATAFLLGASVVVATFPVKL